MKYSNYILIGLVVILLAYIWYSDTSASSVTDQAAKIAYEKEKDSVQQAYGDLYVYTENLEDSIVKIISRNDSTIKGEGIIYETFVDSVYDVVYLDSDVKIRAYSELISQEIDY